MPLYLYENKETEELVEVLQGMSEVHEYQGECGTQKGLWRRVYVNPGLSSDTKMDAFDSKSFIASTVNKNDTYGDLQNRAAAYYGLHVHGPSSGYNAIIASLDMCESIDLYGFDQISVFHLLELLAMGFVVVFNKAFVSQKEKF